MRDLAYISTREKSTDVGDANSSASKEAQGVVRYGRKEEDGEKG